VFFHFDGEGGIGPGYEPVALVGVRFEAPDGPGELEVIERPADHGSGGAGRIVRTPAGPSRGEGGVPAGRPGAGRDTA